MCQLCLPAHTYTCTHTHIIHKHLWDAKGSSGFQCVLWKVLTLANISWCVLFICILGAASASSYCQSFLFECQHYYYSRWCNSRCLSACLSRICLSPRAALSLSASPAFLPSVLFNSYHYVSAKWNPLFLPFCKHLYFSRLDILPLFPTHSDCNGWNGESSLLLSCLSFPIVYSRSLDSVASD